MYRRHLHEMESSSKGGSSAAQQQLSTNNKTGIRTIDAISEIPVVNSALNNVTEYYGKVKERNALLRTSLNLAELSVSVMSLAATPITSLCKKPIESVDSYLYEKLNDLEHSYPSITKPTEQITESAKLQVKQIYNQTLKQPIDRFNNFKDITTNKVNEVLKVGTDSIDSIKSYGCDQINRSAALGVRMVDACLESSLARLFTDPVLNFTERSLDFLIPESATATSNGAIKASVAQQQLVPGTTLRRIYDINSRVYRHVYQYTFVQLNKIHVQFEATIKKLQSLKQLSDAFYSGSRDRFVKTMQSIGNNSLVSQCMLVVNRNNLSLDKMEVFMRTSYRAILEDVAQMVEKYMSLVKNFPVTFNGTKIRQTIESLVSQLNKESFAVILTFSIDQLKTINASLVSYTNQMFQVVNNSRLANLLYARQGQLKSDSQQQQQHTTTTAASKQ